MAHTLHRDEKTFASYADVGVKGKGVYSYQVSAETDGNAATIVSKVPVAELEGVLVRVSGLAVRTNGSEILRSDVKASFRRAAAGNVTLGGAATTVAANDSSGTPTITIVANATDQTADIVVTGEAAKEFVWDLDIKVQRISN